MKKLIMIVAFLLIPFTAMAGMTSLTNSEMNNTTGQLGLGIDVTELNVDVDLSTSQIDIIPATALGMPNQGFFEIGALANVHIDIILNGDIDADIEITPVGIAIALDITNLDINVSDLTLNVDCLADVNGDGNIWLDPADPSLGTDGTLAQMDLLNLSITGLDIGVNLATLMVDVLPTVGLEIGTTQP